MLKVEYDSRKVWKRIITFQGIPLIGGLLASGVATGALALRTTTGIEFLVLAGVALYSLIMAFMINCLRKPTLLSIDEDNILRWRPAFKEFSTRLPKGTRVAFDDKEVVFSPEVPNIPNSHSDGERTVVKLPQGLRRLSHGEIVLA